MIAKIAKLHRDFVTSNSLGILREHLPCFYRVLETRVGVWMNEKCSVITRPRGECFQGFIRALPNFCGCNVWKWEIAYMYPFLCFLLISRSLCFNESTKYILDKSLYWCAEVFSTTVLIWDSETRKQMLCKLTERWMPKIPTAGKLNNWLLTKHGGVESWTTKH